MPYKCSTPFPESPYFTTLYKNKCYLIIFVIYLLIIHSSVGEHMDDLYLLSSVDEVAKEVEELNYIQLCISAVPTHHSAPFPW